MLPCLRIKETEMRGVCVIDSFPFPFGDARRNQTSAVTRSRRIAFSFLLIVYALYVALLRPLLTPSTQGSPSPTPVTLINTQEGPRSRSCPKP